MRRRTTSSEKKPLYSKKYSAYGGSWTSYGTSNGYQSRQPLLSSVDYNDSPPTSPTEKTVKYSMQSTMRNETVISSSQTDSRIGSIKSNYYREVRSQQSTTTFWLLDVIQEMLRYIYSSFAQIRMASCATSNTTEYPEPELKLDPNTQAVLDRFRNLVSEKYDTTNTKHEKLLQRLWDISFPDRKLKNRISQQWKDMGFQGTDPATDFRGGGIFGLWNLIYFADTYPKEYKLMFRKSVQLNGSYPFVIAGLNVTMMLFDILGWGLQARKMRNNNAKKMFIDLLVQTENRWKHNDYWFESLGDSEEEEPDNSEEETKKQKEGVLLDFGNWMPVDNTEQKQEDKPKKKKKKHKKRRRKHKHYVFEELYVLGFRIMDSEWYKMNANYFSFPKVLEAVRQRVQDLLETKFTCLEDIVQHNQSGKL